MPTVLYLLTGWLVIPVEGVCDVFASLELFLDYHWCSSFQLLQDAWAHELAHVLAVKVYG